MALAQLTRLLTPRNAAFVGWAMACLFVGIQAGEVLTARLRSEPVYFCQFGRDCFRSNLVDTHCCRTPSDAAFATPLFTCQPACE